MENGNWNELWDELINNAVSATEDYHMNRKGAAQQKGHHIEKTIGRIKNLHATRKQKSNSC